ncbi:hypothetical protein [Pseudochrobactrum kiredjianiae]|uniref:Uncharacterized protein n=1 Tax=Pseudochrobactrum kiredjianiae TaxID=386305 RepID=A0ABW3V419_9HYPH|nr:hypothetical protein [Pseudochrobactrum kiredjianiae]MDM7853027.1 hypothetical protein [Pseudochrobactrum kiredjianiae]
MPVADSNNSSVDDLTYIYDLTLSLSNISAELSPPSSDFANSNKIKATVSSFYVDGGLPAQNVNIILQINPPASIVTVYDEDHAFIRSYQEGRYRLKTGADGKAVIYFASTGNIYESIQLIAERNASSLSKQHIIFFGDYAAAPARIPPPVLDLNGNDQLEIPTESPYFQITIPSQTPAIVNTGLNCVVITNTKHFTKQSYASALEEGVKIPSAYLDTENNNEIAYFIQNNSDGTTVTSPKVTFKAVGTPYTHPVQSADGSRTLQARPYLNDGQTSITPNNASNLKVFVENKVESDGRHTFEVGDKIIFTVYINGYFKGSDVKKVDVFDLPVIEVKEDRPAKINVTISSDKISGFGSNTHNSPGRYELDYVVKRSNETDIPTLYRPVNWLKGNIVTV